MGRVEQIWISLFTVTSLLAEATRLQFRAEAFNITNTAAFSNPGGSFGSGTFGVINSAGLGRNIQLALKLLF